MTHDEVIAELADLLERSGYVRLEIARAGTGYSGFCIDEQREGFNIGHAAQLAEEDARRNRPDTPGSQSH